MSQLIEVINRKVQQKADYHLRVQVEEDLEVKELLVYEDESIRNIESTRLLSRSEPSRRQIIISSNRSH